VAQAGTQLLYAQNWFNQISKTPSASNDKCYIQYNIPGDFWANLYNQAFTVQFWMRSSTTGKYCFTVQNPSFTRAWTTECNIAVADTWTQFVINISASPTSGVSWGFGPQNIGAILTWCLAVGTGTAQITAGSWQTTTGIALGTTNQVNSLLNTDGGGGGFMLTGIQIEAGSSATSLENRPTQQERALCQRYYQHSWEDTRDAPLNVETGMIKRVHGCTMTTPFMHEMEVCFPITMVATPTVNVFDTSNNVANHVNMYVQGGGGASVTGNISATIENQCTKGFHVYAFGAGATTNGMGFHWKAQSEVS